MKTNNFLLWAVFVIALCITSICIGYSVRGVESNNGYNQTDSIRNASIDSVKGEYQQVIDSLEKVKPKIVYRVKWLKGADTIIYVGEDTLCLEVINRKNALIQGLDSLCEVLDLEARTYSDLNVLEREKTGLEISRFNALSYKTDSIILNYKDSLIQQSKTHKKRIFWTNVKWGVVSALGIYGTFQLGK